MKFTHLLPLAACSAALVFPPEQVLGELAIEDHHQQGWVSEADETTGHLVADLKDAFESIGGEIAAKKGQFSTDLGDFFRDTSKKAHDAWTHLTDEAMGNLHDAYDQFTDDVEALGMQAKETADDFEAWINSEGSFEMFDEALHLPPPPHHPPPHHPPPHHPPPGHEPPHHPPPGHGPPEHHRPHHPKHPQKFNLTVYELIAGSNYTTKLAKLINEHSDLVELLNSTKANYTVFAPTDKAFEGIPDSHKPSKDQVLAILKYHVLPGWFPALRVLSSHTAPTLLDDGHLGKENAQRVAFKLSLRGLTVNFFSRIIAVNIFGTNGVVHGIDHLILPPPSALTIVSRFPGRFSTLELGLRKTGLYDELNSTKHAGGTLFAPSNFAFEKLGPRINAFLFSKYGEKYLKALLEYHVSPGHALYSDAYYKTTDSKADEESIPKGRFHIDLPTLLKDRSLSVDVARFGGLITMKINAFVTVAYQDVIAEDGVVHVLRSVLIPPKRVGSTEIPWDGAEMTVEELKERLEPFVARADL